MSTIYIVRGTASAATELAAYDAALAAANVHNYNLVSVSSIIPADAELEVVDTAPDLGPAGNRLTVVESRATTAEDESICAGLGWAAGPGPGLFYEVTGSDADAVESEIRRGLGDGRALRDWEFTEESVVVSTTHGSDEAFTAAVALAVYGESEPIY
ncbi:MAG: pyruvoyl-dependent arginine decarboxylase [Halobacteriota archaeon]